MAIADLIFLDPDAGITLPAYDAMLVPTPAIPRRLRRALLAPPWDVGLAAEAATEHGIVLARMARCLPLSDSWRIVATNGLMVLTPSTCWLLDREIATIPAFMAAWRHPDNPEAHLPLASPVGVAAAVRGRLCAQPLPGTAGQRVTQPVQQWTEVVNPT